MFIEVECDKGKNWLFSQVSGPVSESWNRGVYTSKGSSQTPVVVIYNPKGRGLWLIRFPEEGLTEGEEN